MRVGPARLPQVERGVPNGGRRSVAFLAQENLAVPPPVPGASVSRVVYELAACLTTEFDVTVVSLPHPSVPEGEHEGIHYLRVPDDYRPHDRAYRQVLRVLRRFDLPHRELQGMRFYARSYARSGLARIAGVDPDIVHLQNVSQFVPIARELVPRARLALHMHCDWLRQLPAGTVRRRLADVDLVLGVSDYVTDRIRDAFPEFADRCHTLHNGVNVERFDPTDPSRPSNAQAMRRQLGVPEGGPVFLYVGTIAPEKGVDVLIDAFAQALERFPDAQLLIVGRPTRYFQVKAPAGRRRRAEIRQRQSGYVRHVNSRAERIAGNVTFAGGLAHTELPAVYALADVFVMPSAEPEPFPLPVLEALASGLPVIASSVGGLPEIVRDRVNGRLVPARNQAALCEAIVDLSGGLETARQLGTNGRELVAAEFSWQAQAHRLGALYSELIAQQT
jgi:glycosyltransferase involved in cell wall biosynthesis